MRITVLLARLGALLGVSLLFLSACTGGGSSGQNVTLQMTEYKFTPDTITVKSGQAVTVELQNKGTVVHDFHIPDLNVASPEVDPGKSAQVTFTPDKPGTYQFECTQPGHAQAGMTGSLVVQ
jgi:uncharacterized cupredoxin-like copper-binding protein